MSKDQDDEDLKGQIEALRQKTADLEAQLLASREEFLALSDSAPVGIFLDDADGKATYINRKCAELIGAPAEAALDFNWITYLHADDVEAVVSAWQRAFENSEEFRLEYRYVHENGRVVWVYGEVIPILDEAGQARMYVGSLTDITAQKEAEKEKAALEVELVQAQKLDSVGRLAGGIAHDFNNMLCAIMNYAELALTEDELHEPIAGYLREIVKAGERSASITRQLLAFARKQVIQPDVFNMREAVKDMLRMVRRLIGEDIKLICLPEDGEFPVRMDASQLDQIVVNLCVNARDAIEGVGTITLEMDRVSVPEDAKVDGATGEYVVLSVTDDGCGMDEATLENAFEPFFTTKEISKGTGLGLSSVYGIVKQNDGCVDVKSEPGVGSTFRVYLPCHTGAVPERVLDEPAAVHMGAGQTVLVVDDELAILESVRTILEGLDYRVLAADSPLAALQLSREDGGEISLLVTDMVMPEMSGRDLAKQLLAERPEMKCLFMTGYPLDVVAEKGGLEDDINLMSKPFRKRELVRKLMQTMNG